jgi:hypothetical protein
MQTTPPTTTQPSVHTDEAVASALLARWSADPVVFAWEALGIRCWKRQRQMLRAMARHPNVAIRSGQKVSKTTTVVIFALWWLFTKADAKVFITSVDYRNVKTVFWGELRRVWRDARKPRIAADGTTIPGVELGGEPALDPSTGYTLPDGRFIKGFTADKVEGWGGYSGPAMLFILDEASGIDQPTFEAIDGNRAGGGTLVMIGNPTEASGPFFDAFHSHRAHWFTMRISGTETPNCTGDEPAIPGLADPAHIAERKRRYGVESPFYTIRVLGDFAASSPDTIVPLGLVERAMRTKLPWVDHEIAIRDRLVIGVDPARYGGDDTVVAARRGRRIFRLGVQNGTSTGDIVRLVVDAVRRWHRPIDLTLPMLPIVNIDSTGGWGAGAADSLRDLTQENGHPLVEVVEVNSSETADDDEMYTNMRTQLLFGVRMFLEEGPAHLTGDDEMAADLVATKYGSDARGRRKAESKDDVKKRLQRSPNKGDAVALCIYTGGAMVHTGRATGGFHTGPTLEELG